jgi:hypothetical protein
VNLSEEGAARRKQSGGEVAARNARARGRGGGMGRRGGGAAPRARRGVRRPAPPRPAGRASARWLPAQGLAALRRRRRRPRGGRGGAGRECARSGN